MQAKGQQAENPGRERIPNQTATSLSVPDSLERNRQRGEQNTEFAEVSTVLTYW